MVKLLIETYTSQPKNLNILLLLLLLLLFIMFIIILLYSHITKRVSCDKKGG